MALLKAFVCQVLLLGLYKVFLEKVVEEHLVPDELTRNCLVGFVCLLCFGIQLYTEKVEEQASHEQASRSKSRRRSPPDMAESVSEFLDARTVHMMKTLDAAMQHMGQMPASDGYVQNVIFAAAGPEAAVIEQTFSTQKDGAVVEEIHVTRLNDVIYANENDDEKSKIHENAPVVLPLKVEEVEEEEENDSEEEVEEETETKSDVCEEDEDDVVTVIDVSKPKLKVAESEEEEEEEETESVIVVNQKSVKTEIKPDIKPSKDEDEDEEEEEEEEEETESVIAVNQKSVKAEVKSNIKPSKDEDEEEEEEEESEEEENEAKTHKK